MDFLDKVKQTAISVAKVSSREGKKLYAVTKLKLEITEKQNQIKGLYKEIGSSAYKAYKSGKNIVKRITGKLEEIDALEETIAVLREKIELIKNTDELGVEDISEEYIEAEEAEIIDVVEEEDLEVDEDDDEDFEADPIEPIE